MKTPQPVSEAAALAAVNQLCALPQVFDSDTFRRTFNIRGIWMALASGAIEPEILRMGTAEPPPLEMTDSTKKHLREMTDEQARFYLLGIRHPEHQIIHLIDGHHRIYKMRELGYAFAFALTITAEEAMRYALTAEQAVREVCKTLLNGDTRYDPMFDALCVKQGRTRRELLAAVVDVLTGDAEPDMLRSIFDPGLN